VRQEFLLWLHKKHHVALEILKSQKESSFGKKEREEREEDEESSQRLLFLLFLLFLSNSLLLSPLSHFAVHLKKHLEGRSFPHPFCAILQVLKIYRGRNELNWNWGKILFLLFSLWESLFFLKSFLGNPSSKDPSCPLALNILLLLLIFIFSLLSFYFNTILLLFKSMTCRARPSHLTVASSRWSMPPRPQITAGIPPFSIFFF